MAIDLDTGRADTFVAVAPRWWVTNAGGVALTGVLAARTGRGLRWLFWGSVAIHIVEALYTYRSAQRAGFTATARRWALQTLGVGFPSLQVLGAAKRAAQ